MISDRSLIIAGVILALAMAAVASPFASTSPDGLERVAQEHGVAATPDPAWNHAAMPDYQVPGAGHGGVSTALAGVIGTLGILVIGMLAGRLLARRSKP